MLPVQVNRLPTHDIQLSMPIYLMQSGYGSKLLTVSHNMFDTIKYYKISLPP